MRCVWWEPQNEEEARVSSDTNRLVERAVELDSTARLVYGVGTIPTDDGLAPLVAIRNGEHPETVTR